MDKYTHILKELKKEIGQKEQSRKAEKETRPRKEEENTPRFSDLYPMGNKENTSESFSELFEKGTSSLDASSGPGSKDRPSEFHRAMSDVVDSGAQATLDLHGMTAADAEKKTAHFIRNAAYGGMNVVLVITGRGRHSEGNAVLPDVVEQVLLEMKAQKIVKGYRWDKKAKYKSGAVIIHL